MLAVGMNCLITRVPCARAASSAAWRSSVPMPGALGLGMHDDLDVAAAHAARSRRGRRRHPRPPARRPRAPAPSHSARTSSTVASASPRSAASRARSSAATAAASSPVGAREAWPWGSVVSIASDSTPVNGPNRPVPSRLLQEWTDVGSAHPRPGCGNCVRIAASHAASGRTARWTIMRSGRRRDRVAGPRTARRERLARSSPRPPRAGRRAGRAVPTRRRPRSRRRPRR